VARSGNCTYKVPNGKLIKVTVEYEGEVISKVQIRGDFFIHPEESIDDLELALKGIDFKKKEITDIVSTFFLKNGLVAFGITPQAVVDAIMMCREEDK
jgi:lipoate-protein ligase A